MLDTLSNFPENRDRLSLRFYTKLAIDERLEDTRPRKNVVAGMALVERKYLPDEHLSGKAPFQSELRAAADQSG